MYNLGRERGVIKIYSIDNLLSFESGWGVRSFVTKGVSFYDWREYLIIQLDYCDFFRIQHPVGVITIQVMLAIMLREQED
jgi:hypothetical protein